MAQSVSNLLQGNTANSTAKTRMKPVQGLVKPNALSFPALDSITSKMPQAGKAKLQSIQSAQAQNPNNSPGISQPGALSFPYADSVRNGSTPGSNIQGVNGSAGTMTTPATPPATNPLPEQTATTEPKPQLNIKRSPKALFPSVLDSLRNKSDATREQERLQRLAEQNALENKGFGRAARDISKKYSTEIDRIGQLGAGAVAGNLSTGSNVVGSGNAAIASQSASARMQALADAQAAEMSGIDRSLSAQAQAQAGIGEALGSANTQQAQGITGLSALGGLAAPMQVPYSNQFIDPSTGQSAGGAGLGGYAGYNAAESAIALARQYPDAGVQYDPNMSPEQNLQRIQQAVQGSPTYQSSTFGTPGVTNVQQATQVQTAQQGYNESYQTYQNIEANLTNAHRLAENLQSVMSSGGINPVDARYVNSKIKDLRRQFSDEQQQSFDTALKEVQAAYSNILNTGGGVIPTEATAASNTILNPNATLGEVNAAIQQLELAANVRVQTQGDRVMNYYNQLNQVGGGASSAGGGSSSFAEQW